MQRQGSVVGNEKIGSLKCALERDAEVVNAGFGVVGGDVEDGC